MLFSVHLYLLQLLVSVVLYKVTFILSESISIWFYFNFCEVYAGFSLVAGVVADVEHIVMPEKAGITCVAAAGEFCQFCHSAALDVDVCQGSM